MPTHHAFVKYSHRPVPTEAITNFPRFTEWAKIYGGMYSLKIGSGTIVVLTDRRLIKELLDKKSSIYSKRPASYLSEFITGGDHVLLMDYRYVFKTHPILMSNSFSLEGEEATIEQWSYISRFKKESQERDCSLTFKPQYQMAGHTQGHTSALHGKYGHQAAYQGCRCRSRPDVQGFLDCARRPYGSSKTIWQFDHHEFR
jgi:hypothetical protein